MSEKINAESKKAANAAAAMRKYQAALSLQSEIPSATPTNVLHWRSIGENKNVTGYAVSSELFAFLGTEARIKTHLLKTIAGCYGTSSVSLNGIPLSSPPMNSSMVDVQDAINLYDSLTVLETLGFSAELRLGHHNYSHNHHRRDSTSNSNSPARIRRGESMRGIAVGHSEIHSHHQPSELLAVRLLTEMGLEEVAEKSVGDLSVWQRRVVLFATEVIAGKDVLFFDRPTSDLDAQSALSLVTSLQRLARGNRLVAITASSLTFREYAILDRIQLLSKGGAIYYGLGSGALSYFEKLSRTPSPGASISDFLLDLVDEEGDIFPGYRGLRDISTLEGIAEGLAKVQSPPFRARPGSSGGVGGAGGGSSWMPGSGGVIRSEYDERGVGREDGRGGGGRERSSSSDSRGPGPGLGPGLGPGRGPKVDFGPALSTPGQGTGLRLGLTNTLWRSPTYSYSGAPRSGGGGGYGSSSSGTTPRGGSNIGGGAGAAADSGHNNNSSSGDGSFFSSLFSRMQDTWFGSGTRASSSEGLGRGFSVVGVGEWTSRQVQQRLRSWWIGVNVCYDSVRNCDCDCSFDEEEDCPNQPLHLKQFTLCLWRGMVVRYRNKDQLYGCWLLAGVMVCLGLSITFRNATGSLDDKCALLTVLPFSMVLLSNLWNEDEYNDRRIFAYERDRGYFASPLLSPLTSLIADVVLYKLLPPICAALTLYPVLGLRSQLAVWLDFLTVMCLVQISGTCFAKAVFSAMATVSVFVPIKAAMVSAFLLSTQILYTGLLVDLSRSAGGGVGGSSTGGAGGGATGGTPSGGVVAIDPSPSSSPSLHWYSWLPLPSGKDLSIFYWGCNVLYWNELSGQTASTTSTGEGPVQVTGDQLLQSLSVAHVPRTTAMTALCIHAIIYIFLVLFCSVRMHSDWRLTKLQRKKKEQEEAEEMRLLQRGYISGEHVGEAASSISSSTSSTRNTQQIQHIRSNADIYAYM